jgi:hypothetical protein
MIGIARVIDIQASVYVGQFCWANDHLFSSPHDFRLIVPFSARKGKRLPIGRQGVRIPGFWSGWLFVTNARVALSPMP